MVHDENASCKIVTALTLTAEFPHNAQEYSTFKLILTSAIEKLITANLGNNSLAGSW